MAQLAREEVDGACQLPAASPYAIGTHLLKIQPWVDGSAAFGVLFGVLCYSSNVASAAPVASGFIPHQFVIENIFQKMSLSSSVLTHNICCYKTYSLQANQNGNFVE